MRTVGIWVFGLLASLIAGGLVGGKFSPGWGSEYELWGALAGALAFACARLWFVQSSTEEF